ncbi:Glc7p regulatory subunit [Datura stramonium]|uniref:Glc7p regulatory subunit n=1 Tax=Datura stramonium TaxID=4076 RepID=A0ABS8SSG3_DATST|nr:Glc7p regulatory subunit [Datura stramonium]
MEEEMGIKNLAFTVSPMDPEAARTARDSLELVFHMSNILDTGLDRHTLSVLISLCDLGHNPEALAAVIKELRQEHPSAQQRTMASSVP